MLGLNAQPTARSLQEAMAFPLVTAFVTPEGHEARIRSPEAAVAMVPDEARVSVVTPEAVEAELMAEEPP